jgi:hypothetical protein
LPILFGDEFGAFPSFGADSGLAVLISGPLAGGPDVERLQQVMAATG